MKASILHGLPDIVTREGSTALDILKQIATKPYAVAKHLQASNGNKVIGYLCDNVPVELINAAGFLACRIGGTPHHERTGYDRLIRSQGRVSEFGLSKAITEALLKGECAFLDRLVIPHNRKAIEAIKGQTARAHHVDATLKLPEMWHLDRTWIHSDRSESFNAASILELKSELEKLAGCEISDTALTQAIAAQNTTRALLAEVMSYRHGQKCKLLGSDALAVIRASQVIPHESAHALLAQLLQELESGEVLTGPKIFMAGSPFDHAEIYRVVEAASGVVVGEDHCWGMRCIEQSIKTDKPLESLSARFNRLPGCSLMSPIQGNVDVCLKRAQACGADAAIFAVMKGDETHVWTTPDEARALEANGMPVLQISELDYRDNHEANLQVNSFVEGLQ